MSLKKWKKELKALKKKKKMLFIIYKKSGSRHELNKIKKICAKPSKKRCDPSSDSSSDDLEYDSSLSRDSI